MSFSHLGSLGCQHALVYIVRHSFLTSDFYSCFQRFDNRGSFSLFFFLPWLYISMWLILHCISAGIQSFTKSACLLNSFQFLIPEHTVHIIFKAGIFGIQGKQHALIWAASINQKASSVQSWSSHISLIISSVFGNNEGHRAQTQCGCHFLQRPCRGSSKSGIIVSAVSSRTAQPAFPTTVDFGPLSFTVELK